LRKINEVRDLLIGLADPEHVTLNAEIIEQGVSGSKRRAGELRPAGPYTQGKTRSERVFATGSVSLLVADTAG